MGHSRPVLLGVSPYRPLRSQRTARMSSLHTRVGAPSLFFLAPGQCPSLLAVWRPVEDRNRRLDVELVYHTRPFALAGGDCNGGDAIRERVHDERLQTGAIAKHSVDTTLVPAARARRTTYVQDRTSCTKTAQAAVGKAGTIRAACRRFVVPERANERGEKALRSCKAPQLAANLTRINVASARGTG